MDLRTACTLTRCPLKQAEDYRAWGSLGLGSRDEALMVTIRTQGPVGRGAAGGPARIWERCTGGWIDRYLRIAFTAACCPLDQAEHYHGA